MKILERMNFAKTWEELLPKLMGDAFKIVVTVTIVGFLFALIFGFLLAIGRFSKSKLFSHIIVIFQELVRGTPLLVQLVYVYYVVPLLIEVIAYLCGIPDVKIEMQAVTAGIIGLGINYGTYLSEVIRSAIMSIDHGQTEAALALGFSNKASMFRIVIPQAFRNSIPVFGNYLVMMVKDTSLMAYITAQEFLLTTKAYTAQTFRTIESYTILAGVYLLICIPLSMLVRLVEKRLSRGRR